MKTPCFLFLRIKKQKTVFDHQIKFSGFLFWRTEGRFIKWLSNKPLMTKKHSKQ